MGPFPTQLELDLRNELALPDTDALTIISHSTDGRERVTAVAFDGDTYRLFVAYRDFMRFPQIRSDDKWWIPQVAPTRDDGSLLLPEPQDITEYATRFTEYPTENEITKFRKLFDRP
jgi:hypothetical protein